jgi:hypothetical protein
VTPRFQAGDRVFIGVPLPSGAVLREGTVLHVNTLRERPLYAVLSKEGDIYANQTEEKLDATPREAWVSALAYEDRRIEECKAFLEDLLKKKADCLAQIRALDEAGAT